MMRNHLHLLRETPSQTADPSGRTLSEDLLHQVENSPWKRTTGENGCMSLEHILAEQSKTLLPTDQNLLLEDQVNQFHPEEGLQENADCNKM